MGILPATLASGARHERPLLGAELVRLIYLDESGISQRETITCVSGVMIHGDRQWRLVEDAIKGLIEKYIPSQSREDFAFHATDIYHGSGYFDRSVWTREIRKNILSDIGNIIYDLDLPIVNGMYKKSTFGVGVLDENALRDQPEMNKLIVSLR